MNYTVKPNVMKKPYTNNVLSYREKDERRTGGSGGGGYYGGTTSNNDSSKKVDLNKQQHNPSNKVTPDTNTSKSSTTQTPKVNSGSSGIGNTKRRPDHKRKDNRVMYTEQEQKEYMKIWFSLAEEAGRNGFTWPESIRE